jgi:hypothetical protein
MDDFSAWSDVLYPEYKWLATSGDQCVLDVVTRILGIVDDDEDDPIVSVMQSSTWAVCMAYRHYRNAGAVLSQEDLQYARNRGGVLGIMIGDNNEIRTATVREYLELRDPGFAVFGIQSSPSPPAA